MWFQDCFGLMESDLDTNLVQTHCHVKTLSKWTLNRNKNKTYCNISDIIFRCVIMVIHNSVQFLMINAGVEIRENFLTKHKFTNLLKTVSPGGETVVQAKGKS